MTEHVVTEEREGQLYVPGLDKPLIRVDYRSIYFDVSDLKLTRDFTTYSGKTSPRLFVRGKATLENCTIGLATSKDVTRNCSFVAEGIHPDEAKHEWRVSFGFLEADWEIGSEDDWFIQGYIPEAVFDEFVAAYKAGEAHGLKLRCKANLWAEPWMQYAPISEDTNWKLGVGKYGADLADGQIESFSWEVEPKKRPAKVKPEDTEAYKMGQRFADDMFEDIEREPPAPNLAPKQGIRWWWWVLIFAVLSLWWLFRNA